jgi:hypothetical protein
VVRTASTARRLRDVIEPIAANVYFAPEAQSAYQALGLSYLPGYFCSRGGCLGQVPGEVVTAAFGVFNPAIVVPAVTEGWQRAGVADVLAARQRGATAALARILGARPERAERATELAARGAAAAAVEGHPIFAGLRSLGWPGDPLGDLWRAADLLREHRGDSHVCAWVARGVDPVAITLLTTRWWGMPLRSYVGTRGWGSGQVDAAVEALRDQGLIEGEELTPAAVELREAIEADTDRGEEAVLEAIGADVEELIGLLSPWARAIVEGGGYPVDPSQLAPLIRDSQRARG